MDNTSAINEIADMLDLPAGHTPEDVVQAARNAWARGIHTCNTGCSRPLCVARRENARLREERDDIMRRWDSDKRIFCGALQLLKEAGLSPGSEELIAAAERFDMPNVKDVTWR